MKKNYSRFWLICIISFLLIMVSLPEHNLVYSKTYKRSERHNPFVANNKLLIDNGWVEQGDTDFSWAPDLQKAWVKYLDSANVATIGFISLRYYSLVENTNWATRQMTDLLKKWGGTKNITISTKDYVDFGVKAGLYLHEYRKGLTPKDYSLKAIRAPINAEGEQIHKKNQGTATANYFFLQPRYSNLYIVFVSMPLDDEQNLMEEMRPFLRSIKIDWKKIPEDPILAIKIPPDDSKHYQSSKKSQDSKSQHLDILSDGEYDSLNEKLIRVGNLPIDDIIKILQESY